MNYLIRCPECGQAMPFTDFLDVRNHMYPYCQRQIDYAFNLVIGQTRVSE